MFYLLSKCHLKPPRVMKIVQASVVLWTYKKDSHGRHPVYIRLTENRKVKYISTGHKCLPENWNQIKNLIKSNAPNAMAMNADIRHQLNVIQKAIVASNVEGVHLTSTDISAMAKDQISGDDFYKFCDKIKLTTKEKNGNTDQIDQFNSRIRKVQSFAPKLAISEITQPFLVRYEKFMFDAGNSTNTIGTNIKFIRRILNLAISHKLLKRENYPFGKEGHKVVFEQTLRTHLPISELGPIIKIIDEPGYPENVRTTGWYWILCCYCGLRYSDAALFNFEEHIIDGYLILKTDKSGEIVSIPVTDDLAKALEMVKGKIIMSNQTVNNHLKMIANDSKIKKNLTFHVARHTFAMHCAKLRIPKEVAQVLLGHADPRTTDIYYHILNETVREEMEKWNRPKEKTDGELDDEIARLIALKRK